jgi:hypothetical protein
MSRSNMDMSYPCRTTKDKNPIHQVSGATITENTFDLPYDLVTPANGTINGGFVDYEEPRYFKVSGNNTESALAKNVKLGDAGRSTFFELDRNIFVGETMYINLDTAPVKTFAFYATSATVIGTTAAALAAGKVTIRNIMLNLAIEDNAVLANSVRAKWEGSGISLRTDYVLPFRNVCNSAMTNITLQIPQMAGTKLKRIINCVFNGTEELDKVADHHNLNSEKIQELNTFIDSQPLQNARLVSDFSTGSYFGNTDYVENEKFLKDSVIQTVPQYAYTWAHIDDFSGDDSLKHEGHNQRHDYGLDLDVPRNYMLKMRTPNAAGNALAEYSFAILSRTLHLGKDGAIWI